MKGFISKHLTKGKALAAGALILVASSTAQAEPTFTAVDMGEVQFPIELDSIGITVATAGGAMIAIWAVYAVGFKLVRKFIRRMGSTV